jgi:hypothetical protein
MLLTRSQWEPEPMDVLTMGLVTTESGILHAGKLSK